MTPEERRAIFKPAFVKALKKDLYPKHINGSNIELNHLLMNI